MISPDFRMTEVIPIIDTYKLFITANHGKYKHSLYNILGDSLWKDLESDFNRVFTVRKELAGVAAYRSDPEQLKKFKDLFLENYQTMTLFNKYFTYGNQKVTITHICANQSFIESSQCHTYLVRFIHKTEEDVDESDLRRDILVVQLWRRVQQDRLLHGPGR